MRTNLFITISTYSLLCLAGAGSLILPNSLSSVQAFSDPETVYLTGKVRDFMESHSDFGITAPGDMGHFVSNVGTVLGADGRPMFSGGGTKVTNQWRDMDGNPIMPSVETDAGLPGGHFDVDVYNKATTKELWHKHEFDDEYDITYIDIAEDTKLLFRKVIPLSYPNNLRVEFINHVAAGGGGTYEFQAGGALMTGPVAGGLTQTFDPAQLTKLKINFGSLALLRGTKPSIAQNDMVNRDGAFTVRMYNTSTNALVYSVCIYAHVKDAYITPPPPPPGSMYDFCGNLLLDVIGTFGDSGDGAVQDLASFDTWFHDKLGTNMSGTHTIDLQRDGAGVYSHCTSEFYPADGMGFGSEGDAHNNYFTFTISSTFVYSACTGQFFEFESNDDAWVFINKKLVLDLGGVNTPSRQYVSLDRLGLVDGQTYPLDLFYAHRRDVPTSNFCMKTNLVLGPGPQVSTSAGFD